MRTRKPFSTISYNSKEFLIKKLKELLEKHIISDYMLIFHFAEQDEANKNHFHVWICPNKTIDTMDFQDYLKEFDPKKPDKPLGCINCVSSVTDEWVLYVQHFPPYLASKGESREYTYSKSDFIYADADCFESLYYHAFKGSQWATRYEMLQKICDGRIDKADLIKTGVVPLNLASQLSALDFLEKKKGTLDRGGRDGHETNNLGMPIDAEFIETDEDMKKYYEKRIKEMQKEVDLMQKRVYDIGRADKVF